MSDMKAFLMSVTFSFAIFVWLEWASSRKPKQRRCKDCKYLGYHHSVAFSGCIIEHAGGSRPNPCEIYTRKWWKIGRPK